MNQYLVLVLDALLHLSTVFILGILVSIVVKLFSRAHVDFRLVGGLFIVFVLGVFKIYLESHIAGFLPGVTPDILFGLMVLLILIVAIVLIYWQYSVPLLGALLSAIVVVALQITAALGVPKLSLHLMPEGQRFAEYAGLASAHTSQLMEQAKNFENKDGPSVLQKALHALAFFTSKDETEALSRDFAAGIEVYKERKALMDSMTEEELADYRQAMAEFLEEQGMAENRYSLSNLKNVQPEDLANMASFMKELNGEFGIEESTDDSDIPSSADSLRQIAKNLNGAELSDYQKEIFESLLSLVDQEDFEAGLEQARAELHELKKDLPVGALLFSESSALNFDLQDVEMPTVEAAESALNSVDPEKVESMQKRVYVPRDLTNYIEYQIQYGVLLLPSVETDTQTWIDAAATIPCKAWFIGDGEKTVAKVIIEKRGLDLGDVWQCRFKGREFTFHLDDVTEKGIHLSAME
jgi:hypothetical protein